LVTPNLEIDFEGEKTKNKSVDSSGIEALTSIFNLAMGHVC